VFIVIKKDHRLKSLIALRITSETHKSNRMTGELQALKFRAVY